MPRSKRPNSTPVHGHKAQPAKAEQMHRERITAMRKRHIIASTGEEGLEIARYRRANRKAIKADGKEVAAIVHKRFHPDAVAA